MIRSLLPNTHEVEQLHFGGGTPTYLNDQQFEALFTTLGERFNLASGAGRDFSIELDVPETLNDAVPSIGISDGRPGNLIALSMVPGGGGNPAAV